MVVEISAAVGALRLLESLRVLLTSRCALGGDGLGHGAEGTGG